MYRVYVHYFFKHRADTGRAKAQDFQERSQVVTGSHDTRKNDMDSPGYKLLFFFDLAFVSEFGFDFDLGHTCRNRHVVTRRAEEHLCSRHKTDLQKLGDKRD